MEILFIATLSGVVGTGLGGGIGALVGSRWGNESSKILSFAAGVMIGLVFFSIIPESLELIHVWLVVLLLCAGAALTFAVNYLLDAVSGTPHSHIPGISHSHDSDSSVRKTDKSKRTASLFLSAAIALHNLPEGLALGSGAKLNIGLGIVWAILITLHNIPIGLAIGAASAAEGKSILRGVLIAACSGIPMVIGAGIGIAVGSAGDLFLGAVFAVSGGALLYVDFCEIIPQVIRGGHNVKTGFCILIGAVTTLLAVYLLHL
ncbi:MAG: ZIP family metal transporter [Clostridiales Family XIII bacterium]|jgi:ZIP family zinc transporter|nr:ZIP family metal transporter [Clostridiales Family XIII bacterium]